MVEDAVSFGISSLHFGPNAVKAILKIASQITIKKHRCYGEDAKIRDERAAHNQKILWEECGIQVKNWFNVDG